VRHRTATRTNTATQTVAVAIATVILRVAQDAIQNIICTDGRHIRVRHTLLRGAILPRHAITTAVSIATITATATLTVTALITAAVAAVVCSGRVVTVVALTVSACGAAVVGVVPGHRNNRRDTVLHVEHIAAIASGTSVDVMRHAPIATALAATLLACTGTGITADTSGAERPSRTSPRYSVTIR
jgi:hypothetical protein